MGKVAPAVAVLMASIVMSATALGSFGMLASFGETGSGAGTIGPHAPALTVDPAGRVYVADAKDDRIEAFTNAGDPDGGWGGLADPRGVAAAPDGSVVVSDSGGVYRFAPDGSGRELLSAISGPGGVAVGADGTVYVADPAHDRALALGGPSFAGVPNAIAVAVAPDGAVYVTGSDGVHAFSAAATPLGTWPAAGAEGVAVAPDGSVLVAQPQANRVVAFAADGTRTGDFGAPSESDGRLNGPRGVATDCRGNAYVVDNSALRVHVFGDGGPPPPCPQPVVATPQPTVQPQATPEPVVEVAGVVATPEPEPEPLLGVRGRATAVDGTVQVGSQGHLHELHGHELLPVGAVVDASEGRVKLEFETKPGADRDTYGHFMDGEFYDGAFTIVQTTSDSLVDLKLLDEEELPVAGRVARASAAKKKRLKVWGKVKGRFRTVGKNGAATVRGTQWLTSEHDNGTLFRVAEGVVAVKDFATGKTVILRAGEQFLAKPACVSRRSFRIRLRTPSGARVIAAVVTIGGKRVAVRRGARLTAPVDLRGKPEGTVRIHIRVRTADGRLLSGVRTYRTCRSEPLRGKRPLL